MSSGCSRRRRHAPDLAARLPPLHLRIGGTMRTLIIGCGGAGVVYYNPLYEKPANAQPRDIYGEATADAKSDEAVRRQRIITDTICHHSSTPDQEIETVDVDPIRCPTYTLDLSKADDISKLSEIRDQFESVIVESFPAFVITGENASMLFRNIAAVLKTQGHFKMNSGVVQGEARAKLLEHMRQAGFDDIQEDDMRFMSVTAKKAA